MAKKSNGASGGKGPKEKQQPERGKPVEDRGKITSEFPKASLRDCIQMPDVIENKNSGRGMTPRDLATGINKSPGSSTFRVLLSASYKYGLTVGSFVASKIDIKELGQRIVFPKSNEDKQAAIVEAALTPSVFRQIYEGYKGKRLPENQFFISALVRDFGIPREHAELCVTIFLDNVEFAGLVRETSNGRLLSADFTPTPIHETLSDEMKAGVEAEAEAEAEAQAKGDTDNNGQKPPPPSAGRIEIPPRAEEQAKNRNVFVTHGKNKSLISHLKELLEYGGFVPVVSVERESVSKPVPDKVMDDMRSCGAAIIHVDAERELITPEGGKEIVLNSNVLIEIGGAMALYGRRFILLVERGVRLPSNLSGLYEVRYEGEKLDGEATLKLLKAFNDFKNYNPPTVLAAT